MQAKGGKGTFVWCWKLGHQLQERR